MAGGPGWGVKWNVPQIQKITTVAPAAAHRQGSAIGAGVAARGVGGEGTGALARDLSRPKPTGPLSSQAGSDLPYAGMENHGGTIRAKRAKRMVIVAGRRKASGGRARSTVGGEIVATATEVQHRGKHFLEACLRAYPPAVIAVLRRML